MDAYEPRCNHASNLRRGQAYLVEERPVVQSHGLDVIEIRLQKPHVVFQAAPAQPSPTMHTHTHTCTRNPQPCAGPATSDTNLDQHSVDPRHSLSKTLCAMLHAKAKKQSAEPKQKRGWFDFRQDAALHATSAGPACMAHKCMHKLQIAHSADIAHKTLVSV